ncbi:MAG: 2-phosphosulfolactate phosphatase [Planctomycetaceae bacterium]
MSQPLRVHLLPTLIPPGQLRGGVVVVIDILRASTVIVHALAQGAVQVIPVSSVEAARERAEQLHRQGTPRILLGGERHCQLIPGFDLGNSPLDYTPARMSGSTVVFTTTNGTRAMSLCQEADEILIGAFVNLAAVVSHLKNETRPIHLVCAGTDGEITGEDVLFAGQVAVALKKHGRPNDTVPATQISRVTDVQTDLAIAWVQQQDPDGLRTIELLMESRGASSLKELGYLDDIERCGTANLFDIIPVLNPSTGVLRPLGNSPGSSN